MFLETKRDGETITKPDIYALPTLIAWLEKMPAKKRYDFLNCEGRCLIGQYMTAHGIEHVFGDGQYSAFSNRTDWCFTIAVKRPCTFGAALARARELAAHAEGAGD